jgi:hypothetical protein
MEFLRCLSQSTEKRQTIFGINFTWQPVICHNRILIIKELTETNIFLELKQPYIPSLKAWALRPKGRDCVKAYMLEYDEFGRGQYVYAGIFTIPAKIARKNWESYIDKEIE